MGNTPVDRSKIIIAFQFDEAVVAPAFMQQGVRLERRPDISQRWQFFDLGREARHHVFSTRARL